MIRVTDPTLSLSLLGQNWQSIFKNISNTYNKDSVLFFVFYKKKNPTIKYTQ